MQILFFASIREQLESDGEVWNDLSGHSNIRDVLSTLQERGENWRNTLHEDRLLVALNQQMTSIDAKISEEDELAFFPPVTGG